MSDVTHILQAVEHGDAKAANVLLTPVQVAKAVTSRQPREGPLRQELNPWVWELREVSEENPNPT